ncbi:MAG: phosphodiester glycosidase family protein [Actinobacteria bacterium]|nr:phosphodiester glycosidase family protein [Actinomycetota bacterium]
MSDEVAPLDAEFLLERRAHARRRRIALRVSVLVALGLLAPVVYSWVDMAVQPSSLPLSVRTVEWIRQNHGNWLVDQAESLYYGKLNAPKKGGPQLKALPAVGLVPARVHHRARRHVTPWPPAIRPVFAQPLPGEGAWKPSGPSVNGGPPVLLTTFRSELAYPRVVAYVAWFDHTRTALAWYPGRYEPPRAPARGPFSIPHDQRWRLLATFNGGFTYIDGQNGSAVNGVTNEPLKDGLATLVGYRDGHVNIVVWHGGPTAPPYVAWARQSLPPIVWNGQLNPALNDSTQWGFTLGNKVRVWRTGVGVDRRGNLVYAAADYQTVESLARILQRAGAVRAMQFDINPEWPSLITYTHAGGLVPTKVVPNPQQPATRYLVPDDRDFVAVYRRLPGPITVPFK